jgi:membrane protein DedA with SNARE-associated domain
MELFKQLETYVLELSKIVPLELFIFLGSFIEELFPPIPSALITVTAGTVLATRDFSFVYIIWLAVFGAVGKCIGSSIIYVVSDKAEDVVLGKFGKFIGVSHKHVEGLAKHFNGGWKDHVTLFVLRALPIMPSTPVSVMSGVIKINFKTYLLQTFLGTVVRDIFFIYIGTLGVAVYGKFTPFLEKTEDLIKYGFVAAVILIVGYIIVKKYKDKVADKIMGQ